VSRPRVVVLDYGSGNLLSAQRALVRAGAEVVVTAERDAAFECDGLVVPGVGAFAACMEGLRRVRGPEIVGRRLAGGRPVLGICVGMQVMFERGVEHGVVTEGFAEWPGVVDELTARVLPHMGWNTVDAPVDSVLFDGVRDERFYFVHSYAARTWELAGSASDAASDAASEAPSEAPSDAASETPSETPSRLTPALVTWTTHGEPFVAAVENGPLAATQFHPEKSGDAGLTLLRNWLTTLR